MSKEIETKRLLRQWIADKSKSISMDCIQHDTDILEKRIITSVQLMDLIMYLEYLMDQPVDVTQLKPGVFNSIDAIYANFFEKTEDEAEVA